MRKTVTVFAATGVAGSACVEELLRQDVFDVRILARKVGHAEKSSSGSPPAGSQNATRARGSSRAAATASRHSCGEGWRSNCSSRHFRKASWPPPWSWFRPISRARPPGRSPTLSAASMA